MNGSPAHGELTDITGFTLSIAPPTIPWTEHSMELSGTSGKKYFSVEFEHGYDRPAGSNWDECVAEPEILTIWNIDVTEGYGLGSAALAKLIDHAKAEGFRAARMGIINPRMLGVVNKLRRLGIIEKSFFRLERGEHVRPLPPTSEIGVKGNFVLVFSLFCICY